MTRSTNSAAVLVALLVASLLRASTAGRPARGSGHSSMQLHVVRQCDATDEAGLSFTKVFVRGGVMSQHALDRLVEQGRCPELLFTNMELKTKFDAAKKNNVPLELHVETRTDAATRSTGSKFAGDGDPPAKEGDLAYVESYGNMGVHSLMLRDRPRCEWYRAQIERACARIKGAVVLDVGAGTGLLSLFAARAGAKKVYAVESNERVARLARKIIADNGFEEVVEVISSRIEEISLAEQVDIIVSEWMGFYLLHESMLDSVLIARDRFLKPAGVLIPAHATLLAVPVATPALWMEKVGFLACPDATYGLNYTSASELAGREVSASPLIELISKEAMMAGPQVVWRGDLASVRTDELDLISSDLEFHINGAASRHNGAPLHGICLFFQCHCAKGDMRDSDADASEEGVFSTGPVDPPTHWKQSVIVLPQPLVLQQKPTRLRCHVALRRAGSAGNGSMGGGGGGRGGGAGGSQRCRQYLLSLMLSEEPAAGSKG